MIVLIVAIICASVRGAKLEAARVAFTAATASVMAAAMILSLSAYICVCLSIFSFCF
jgi:hypothetical protein